MYSGGEFGFSVLFFRISLLQVPQQEVTGSVKFGAGGHHIVDYNPALRFFPRLSLASKLKEQLYWCSIMVNVLVKI